MLEPGNEKEVLYLEDYTIDHALYESICDVNFISDNNNTGDDHSFRCMIAVKVNSILSIKIFDINQEDEIRTLSYISQASKLVVQISDNH